jgi:hypothetical protein
MLVPCLSCTHRPAFAMLPLLLQTPPASPHCLPACPVSAQYLGQGLSASQLAAQYDAVTALGPSVDDPTLDVEVCDRL